MRFRLSLLSFLEFAVWGSFLTSVGAFLSSLGYGDRIGWFFVAQGIMAIVMPSIVGYVADRCGAPQKVLAVSHLASAACMSALGILSLMGFTSFLILFFLYCLALFWFIPTISLHNSVIFAVMSRYNINKVGEYPRVRAWGTIGFIAAMWLVNFLHIMTSGYQFILSAVFSLALAAHTLTIALEKNSGQTAIASIGERVGLGALSLFKRREMASFFILTILIGVCLQINNAFATPYLESYGAYSLTLDSFVVRNPEFLLSLSQVSEALCFMLVPFALRRFGIKTVVVIAIAAWVVRFAFLGFGNPLGGLAYLIASMIIYGVAFDFFNIAGSMYVEKMVGEKYRSQAQGLFLTFNNGVATILGMAVFQKVMNLFVFTEKVGGRFYSIGNWSGFWIICAAYALVVAVLFVLLQPKVREDGIK